jgi:transcription antitermination factor NusG
VTWYAIRTAPGAQMPQREYAVETTRSTKGYRIVRSLDPQISAIERALSEAGIEHYMPAEKRLVRNRRQPFAWTPRRFALMVGYVFVRDPNWGRLAAVPGVLGVVGVDGRATPIDFLDILRVWDAEIAASATFQQQSRKARQSLRKLAKKDPAIRKIVERLDIAGTISVPLAEVAAA